MRCSGTSWTAAVTGHTVSPVPEAGNHVCYWHKADISVVINDVCFWGKADIGRSNL
jgi:hypothetical protein